MIEAPEFYLFIHKDILQVIREPLHGAFYSLFRFYLQDQVHSSLKVKAHMDLFYIVFPNGWKFLGYRGYQE